MKVLGIDPGTAVTGFGVIETGNGGPEPGHLVECGVIRFARRSPLPRRLHELHAGIVELIERHHPDVLALENAFYHKNVRTTLVLGHARGVVLLAAHQAGLAIAEYPPATVKKAVTGAGGAHKSQVGAMVARLVGGRAPPPPGVGGAGGGGALPTRLPRSAGRTRPAPRPRPPTGS